MKNMTSLDLLEAGHELMAQKLSGEEPQVPFENPSVHEITYGTNAQFQEIVPFLLKAGAKLMMEKHAHAGQS